MIWVPELNEENMQIIFKSILEGHLKAKSKSDKEKRGTLVNYAKYIV
jgi:hypothetical protein